MLLKEYNMKKIYEFLLWNNCSNNCTFCHQRAHERKVDDKILLPKEQIESLLTCQEFLKSDKFEKGNHILLVGGEIFDTTNFEVKIVLRDLLVQVLNWMEQNIIDLFYINTNLLYTNTDLLCDFLDKVQEKQLFSRLKFTTSYDIVGRFTSKERELLFYHNLKALTDKYLDLNIVVNTVLTNEACKRIQENHFGADYLLEYLKEQNKEIWTIKDWIEYFKVQINTIPYIKLPYDLAPEMPTKSMVFNTLLHIESLIPNYLKEYAENIALTQEKLLWEYNKLDKEFKYCSSKLANCGHSVNFQLSFKDSDECFPCAIKKLAKYKA